MNQKAEGLTLSTIIIAAIVLIVLVVVISVFTGYFGDFLPDLGKATTRSCIPTDDVYPAFEVDGCNDNGKDPDDQQIYGKFDESLPEGKICCKRV